MLRLLAKDYITKHWKNEERNEEIDSDLEYQKHLKVRDKEEKWLRERLTPEEWLHVISLTNIIDIAAERRCELIYLAGAEDRENMLR